MTQNSQKIQNTADIKPANGGNFSVGQNSNSHQRTVANRNTYNQDYGAGEKAMTDDNKINNNNNNNNFEDSFLAQVEGAIQKKSADIIPSSKKTNNFKYPKTKTNIDNQDNRSKKYVRASNQELNFGIIQTGVDRAIEKSKLANITSINNNNRKTINNIDTEDSNNSTNTNHNSNIKIGNIEYGMHSDAEENIQKNNIVTSISGDNNGQNLSEERNSQIEIINKKIGDFLTPKYSKRSKKNINSRFKIGKNKFLPTLRNKNQFAISSFVKGVVATSFVVLAVGFVSFGFQTKDDIEVRGARAVNYIKEAKVDLQNKDFSLATTNLVSAKEEFSEAQKQIDKLGGDSLDIFSHIPFLSKISSGKNVVKLGDNLTEAVMQLSKASELLAGVGNPLNLEDENRTSLTDIFLVIQENVNLSKKYLKEAERASAKIKVSDLPKDYQEKIRFIKEFLPLVNESLDEFNRSAEIFLELFGQNGPRKYLIVFQNNQEARATGGFIGSYGLLETNQGKIDRLKIEGIYNPDGQLKVHIVPPKPIQKVSAAWSTHDANWWPDFPKSAEKISWFYEKTGGPTVDGVIAVTPVLLQKMLEITGPIEMEAYGKTITSKNFIKEIQQEVEVDAKERNIDSEQNKTIQEGERKIIKNDKSTLLQSEEKSATENKDPKKILADLTPKIFAKFFDLENPKQAGAVVKILLDALREKHILINFFDSSIQRVVSRQGWSGEVLKSEKDYLMVVNTNINGYKTDGVIEEEINHQAKINKDGSIIDTVTITRKHNGGNTKYEWWNKVNADYMRVYVPAGSKLISAEGQTREINNDRLNYDKLGFQRDPDIVMEERYMEIDEDSGTRIYKDSGKTVFANWVYVSPQERVTVVYKYLLPFKVDLSNKQDNRYSLLIQKQSGSVNSKIKSEIEFPFAWTAVWMEPRALNWDKRNGKLIFSHKLDTDQFFGAVFKE